LNEDSVEEFAAVAARIARRWRSRVAHAGESADPPG